MALNRYEGLFIFPEALKDDVVETALEKVRGEITKSGGRIENITRLGRRGFARRLNKQQGGHFVVVNFDLEGDKIHALQARFKLNEDIFRVQVVRAPEIQADSVASSVKEEKHHGIA